MQTAQNRRSHPARLPMESYLREIDSTPLLDAEEERELAWRIDAGDAEARDHLVRANLRLVVRLARTYLGRGLSLEDLIAEGNLGLLRAAEGFDPSMNTRFSTYASYWIKQSIKRALVNTGKAIRIPAYMVELLTRWRRASAKLQEELGRPPTEQEVASSLNLSRKKLNVIKKAIRVYNSAAPQDGDGAGVPLGELARDPGSCPEVGLSGAEEVAQVLALLGKMDSRQEAVLRMRFGLDGEEPKTLKEIGERLNLTRERVRQIEGEGLRALREKLEGA